MPDGSSRLSSGATETGLALVRSLPDTNTRSPHAAITSALFLAAALLLGIAFILSRRARDAARQRDHMREQLRQLQIESMDLARSADQHRAAEEAQRSEVAALEAKVADLREEATLPRAVDALSRRQRRRLQLLHGPVSVDGYAGEAVPG